MSSANPVPNLRGAVDLSGLARRAAAPSQPGGAAPSGQIVFTADDQSFTRVVELSQTVPVLVEFTDDRAPASGADAIVQSYGGRLALARVDAMSNPQLAQAFQLQQIPFFAAVIGGRPLPLFAGMLEETEFRGVVDQVLQVAEQNGVTGTISVGGEDGEAEPLEPPLPPLHQEAFDAISRGDWAAATAAYETALAQNPRDTDAVAGLAQVRLQERLATGQADEADAAIATGDAKRAFDLLLTAFAAAAPDERDGIRARLLDYFEIVGVDAPDVLDARRRLASLLY